MSLSKVDQAITVIKFHIKKERAEINEFKKRLDISEKQHIKLGARLDFIYNVETLIKQFTEEINKNLGRIPPKATELEQSVLGAMMLEKQKLNDKVKSFLRPEHFYVAANQLVYKAILDLGDNPVDMHTVIDQLRKNGDIETSGGHYYIALLTSKVSSAANIEYHSRVLVQQAIKREMIKLGSQSIDEGYDDTADVFMSLDRLENGIKELKSWIK